MCDVVSDVSQGCGEPSKGSKVKEEESQGCDEEQKQQDETPKEPPRAHKDLPVREREMVHHVSGAVMHNLSKLSGEKGLKNRVNVAEATSLHSMKQSPTCPHDVCPQPFSNMSYDVCPQPFSNMSCDACPQPFSNMSCDVCPQPFSQNPNLVFSVCNPAVTSNGSPHVSHRNESGRPQGASADTAWGASAEELGENTVPASLSGTGGGRDHEPGTKSDVTSPEIGSSDQQDGSSQVGSPGLHDQHTGGENQRPGNHRTVETQGSGSSLSGHSGAQPGLPGFRAVLPSDVRGCPSGLSRLCEVGSDTVKGGLSVAKDGAVPEVARCESGVQSHDAEGNQVPEEQACRQPGRRPEQCCPLAGQECPANVGRDQRDQGEPAGSSQDQHELKGREYFERMGGHDGHGSPVMSMASVASEGDQGLQLGELGVSGELDPSHVKQLCQVAERATPDQFMNLVHYDRPVLFELACGPSSRLTDEMRKQTKRESSAQRLSFWNGFDFTSNKGVRAAMEKIEKERPGHVWLSLECGPFSRMQNVNQRTAQQREELKQKRANCIRQYVGGLVIYTHCCQLGIPCTWEWSETCEAWRLPMVQKVFQKYEPFMVVTNGCRVGLRDGKSHGLIQKGWKLATTHEGLAKAMDLPCMCSGVHVKCQGKLTKESAYYTDDFARRVCRALLQGVTWQGLTAELMGEHGGPRQFHGFTQECSCHEIQHPRSEVRCNMCEKQGAQSEAFSWVNQGEPLPPLTEEEKQRCLQQLSMIHRNTGHGPVEHMVRALEIRKADPRIVELARQFSCSICHEQKRHVPRPRVHLEPLPPKWQSIQVDSAHWRHPSNGKRYQFLIMVDEGSRFRLGKVVCEGSENVKGVDLIDFFQQQWKPVFGCPDKIRLDPAGALRSEEVTNYFNNLGVEVDLIPAEAHWQNSLAERSIQSTKHVMTRLLTAEPSMSVQEALSESIRVENEREIVRGYSPSQHALGKTPELNGKLHVSNIQDMPAVLCENGNGEFPRILARMKTAEMAFQEWVYDERMTRAKNTRSYRQEVFTPGESLSGECKPRVQQTVPGQEDSRVPQESWRRKHGWTIKGIIGPGQSFGLSEEIGC